MRVVRLKMMIYSLDVSSVGVQGDARLMPGCLWHRSPINHSIFFCSSLNTVFVFILIPSKFLFLYWFCFCCSSCAYQPYHLSETNLKRFQFCFCCFHCFFLFFCVQRSFFQFGIVFVCFRAFSIFLDKSNLRVIIPYGSSKVCLWRCCRLSRLHFIIIIICLFASKRI